ncbi:MAG: S8 family serine peptidase, partial [Gemmatimonadetes bacterium]|nr:S8 family serine peptidase [Gemmatimonadota bacterium]
NSWGVNEGFSGYLDCDSRWWTAMDNCEAAGVVLTWSAGNEGPGSTSLRSPADRADSPYNAFSVGSTITSPPYTISSFSSRGPSGCGGAYAMKPEVSAPGSNIYSAQPGGGYQLLSGTSMAGPHVAGVVALMRAANPDLDVETVKQILMDTAVDLGTVGEDNTYGHGIINAYEAVLAALSGYGTIEGTVTDAVSGLPVPSATVDVVGDPRTSTADASGFFRILLPEGSWDLDYSAFGHVTDTQTINVIADTVVDGSLALAPVPSATVSGTVIDYNLNPVAGATVSVMGTPLAPATTAGDGTYSLSVPDGDTYTFLGAAAGLGGVQQTVAISGNTTVDFVLPELMAEDFESGGFTSWPWVMSGTAPWTISTTNVHEGSYSARSGVISHNQSSTMEVTVDLAAAGDISFWYTVSSELSYDFLRFYIDGVQRNSWSGSIGWTQATYAVTAGTHTFRWSYTKDISVNTGSDAAWVDFIDFPPLVSPTPDIAIAPGSISETLAPGGTSSQSLTIDNVGDAQLNYNVSIVGGPLSWLDTSATSGSVPAAGSGSLDVLFDATGLASGPYTATLRLTTNDPDESQVDVPITLDVSGSTDVIVGAQPTAFELANPQPNPFGSATTIVYAIPNEAQAVSIAVYDVAGKLVRTLVNGVQPVGRHVAIWDGRDASGSRVASGVYFTRMDAGEFSDVKKVTLLK